MTKHLTVVDYMRDAKRSQKAFLKRYSAPFLVIIDKPTVDNAIDRPSFITNTFISITDKDSTFGGGPVLEPDAFVLPVEKKPESVTQKSALATTVMVGRNEGNDVVIASEGVSKYHFYISAQPFSIDEYTITDNGSKNGTFVNNQMVLPAKRVPIKSGDKIALGNVIGLRFYLAKDFWEILQKI